MCGKKGDSPYRKKYSKTKRHHPNENQKFLDQKKNNLLHLIEEESRQRE